MLKLRKSILLLAVCLPLAGCGGIAARGKNAEGVRLYQQAQYQEALRQFQQATNDDPANADGYYNQAATYHRLGKTENRQAYLDQAQTLYNQCLDRNPNHPECHRALAVLLVEQGRKDEAFRLLEGWVDRQPGLPDAKIELARLCDEQGNRQAAKDRLVEALNIEPDNSRALAALGKIREDMGESAQALTAYQRSLARDGRQPEVVARVAALQSATQPVVATLPTPASSTASGQSSPLR
jgi:tetratricopeptide (TPR) repeat protein